MTGSEPSTGRDAALFTEYVPALYRFAYRFLQDRGRAEDVVEQVLRWARHHPERLDPATGPVRAVLFTVARDILTDLWRADQARPGGVAGEMAVETIPADDVFDRLVDAWQVEEAMADLSPRQRQVLQEVYYRGRSVNEAARELGIAPGTVKSRTHYALRALHAALERRGLVTTTSPGVASLLDASSFGDPAVVSLSARGRMPGGSSPGAAEVHPLVRAGTVTALTRRVSGWGGPSR